MSKALDYLLKARPQVMGSYFAFLRQAGKHLDPKTRALISVITKVDNQTEQGLRQYVARALKVGVTADEILDAMLVAFPSLGLTKVVWAIDVLITMDIPEFRIENLGQHESWQEIISVSELPDSGAAFIDRREHRFLVSRNGEDIKVFDHRCPHQSTPFIEAGLNGERLTCPKHGWQFDVRTGSCIAIGDRPLHRLEHKIENEMLFVKFRRMGDDNGRLATGRSFREQS